MRGVPGWQLTRCIVPTLLRGAESIRMIYRARAGTFFCIFFVFLARVSSGVRSMLWGSRIILPKTKQKIKILNWASQGIKTARGSPSTKIKNRKAPFYDSAGEKKRGEGNMKLVHCLKLNTRIKYMGTITLVFMSRPLRSKVLSKFTFTSCVCVWSNTCI